ncbi:MAG: HAD family hydrolase [Bacillota bacterium]
MKAVRLILFDLDGTLVRSAGAGRRAIAKAWAAVFGRAVDLDGRWTAGRTDPAIFRELGRRCGLESELEARWPELERRYLSALEEEVARHPGELLPGVVEILEWAERRGWALGLGTGNLRAGARLKLAPFGLSRFFPVGGFGEDGEDRAELLKVAARRASLRFGRPADPVVVVGDTPLDVEAAHRAGFLAVAVATGPYGADDLRQSGAEGVLQSFDPWKRAARLLDSVCSPSR